MRPLALALVCALACALAATAPRAAVADAQAARLYEDALARYEKKDIGGAIIQLKNALQHDKSMLPVHVLLGKALLANSDVVGAEVALNEALRLGVNRAEVVLPLARSVLGQGKPQAVLDSPQLAPAGLPPGVQAPLLLLLATAHADLGQTREAIKAIEEARAIAPSAADSWMAEVSIRIRARQFTEASAAADRAVALAPGSAQAHYLRGSIAHAQGKLSAALPAYDQAIKLQPGHVEALLARAGVHLDQNRLTLAQRDIAELRRSQPREPRGAYLSAVMAEREGQAKAARAALADITGLLDPVPMEFMRYRPQLLILGGLAHYGLGQREKAKPYLEAVQRDQPGSAASKLLAQIHLADKNVDRAIESLEAYLRATPNDTQALILLASAHMSKGRHARATQILREALRGQDSPPLRAVLGLSLIGAGKATDATAELEAAYKKDPAQIQAGSALVSLYLHARQTKQALGIAESLLKQQPAQPGLHNLLGLARAQAGDSVRARAAFEQAVKLDAHFIDPQLNLARLDVQTRAYDAAAARLSGILQAHEMHVEALLEMGLLAERRGQMAEATRWLEKAADHSGPAELGPALMLVDFHLRGGRFGAAQEAVKRLDLKAPEDLLVLTANARVNLANKNAVGARSYLTKATRVANFDAPMQTRIALLQLAADDARGAAYSLSKALSAQPEYLPAQALMTDAEIRLGELARAEQRAREIVARHPKAGVGHGLLGDIAMARRQTAAAVEPYRRAHQLESSSDSLLRLHRALALIDGPGASLLAEQWVTSHPQDLAVRRALADGHARAGNLPAARAAYAALIRVAPDDAEALNNYAHVLLQLRDPAAAGIAQQALAKKPEAAHIIGTAGWVAFKAGQPERALQLLRDARLRDPANPDTRYFLAAVLASTGRATEAREELETALRGGQSFASAKDARQLLATLK